jgi:hypothetical protein
MMERRATYASKPSVCTNCNIVLSFERKNDKFCGRSCAATFNNKGVRRHGKPDQQCLNCELVCSKKYCSIACSVFGKNKELVDSWLNGEVSGLNKNGVVTHYVKQWLRETRGNACELCGWCKVHPVTGKIPVQADHTDGNSQNNRPENLKLLCPNCHSLTKTFGALNRGNGRASRRASYLKANLRK